MMGSVHVKKYQKIYDSSNKINFIPLPYTLLQNELLLLHQSFVLKWEVHCKKSLKRFLSKISVMDVH